MRSKRWAFRCCKRKEIAQIASRSHGAYGPPRPHNESIERAMSSAPDDVLHLLRQRGRDPDPAALDSLMRGVAAAPEGLAGPEWVELIDPKADAELTSALAAWRAELARASGGLGQSPAPAERLAALRAELTRRGLDG